MAGWNHAHELLMLSRIAEVGSSGGQGGEEAARGIQDEGRCCVGCLVVFPMCPRYTLYSVHGVCA